GSLLALTRAVFVTVPAAAGGASTVTVMTTVSGPVPATPSSAARLGRSRRRVLPGPGGMVPVPPGGDGSAAWGALRIWRRSSRSSGTVTFVATVGPVLVAVMV